MPGSLSPSPPSCPANAGHPANDARAIEERQRKSRRLTVRKSAESRLAWPDPVAGETTAFREDLISVFVEEQQLTT
jgi:hypothetical protein